MSTMSERLAERVQFCNACTSALTHTWLHYVAATHHLISQLCLRATPPLSTPSPQGYATGISSACVATGSLLLHALRFALLPLGLAGRGTTGRMLEGAARTLTLLLHSVCHAVAFAGRL